MNDGVGASAVFPDRCLTQHLSTFASTFTAELVAILMALSRINFINGEASFVIYSDSQSALQSLRVLYPKNSLVLIIQKFLHRLHSRKKVVTFCWVPSHVGVAGNEAADREAKQTSSDYHRHSGYLPLIIRKGFLPSSDFVPCLNRGFRARWQECWSSDIQGSKLRKIKPHLRNWSSSYNRNRLQESVLSRLRIGHTHLTHGHYMTGTLPSHCQFCLNHAPQSVHHFFVDCPKLDNVRRQIFPALGAVSPNDKLAYILAESPNFDSNRVFAFLSTIGILYNI